MYKYQIDIDHTFDPEAHPLAMSELSIIGHNMAQVPCANKGEIVISFLKDHSLKVTWIDESRQITDMLTSGFLEMSNLESLFEACRHSPIFRNSFEGVIRQRIA